MSNKERPLSPHLQVYAFRLNMVLSGIHRITGLALGLGSMLLVWWVWALAEGAAAFQTFQTFAIHPIGRLVLFGFTFSLIFHALNGLRHLFWDTGRGFEKKTVKTTGIVVVILTTVITLGVWVFAYSQAGKF